MPFEPILTVCRLTELTAAGLAKELGVKPPTVYAWRDQRMQVSPKMAVRINALCPEVTLSQLRPLDWQELWPNLSTGPTPAAN